MATHLSLREFRSINLALGINWCLLGSSKVDWPSRKCRAASRSCRESSSDITARLLVRFSSFLRSCVDCAECESWRLASLELKLQLDSETRSWSRAFCIFAPLPPPPRRIPDATSCRIAGTRLLRLELSISGIVSRTRAWDRCGWILLSHAWRHFNLINSSAWISVLSKASKRGILISKIDRLAIEHVRSNLCHQPRYKMRDQRRALLTIRVLKIERTQYFLINGSTWDREFPRQWRVA